MGNSVMIVILFAIVFFFIGAITAFMYISISRWHVTGRRYMLTDALEYEPELDKEVLNVRQKKGVDDKSALDEFKIG